MGIFETVDNVYSQDDLDQFYSEAPANVPKGTGPKINLINNATAPYPSSQAGVESDLDFEMAIPIIYPQKSTLYQVSYLPPKNSSQYYDVFNDFLDAFSGPYCQDDGDSGSGKDCNELAPPAVISISWGSAEDPSQTQFNQVRFHAVPNLRLKCGLTLYVFLTYSGNALSG